jgi:hypothetical protein
MHASESAFVALFLQPLFCAGHHLSHLHEVVQVHLSMPAQVPV